MAEDKTLTVEETENKLTLRQKDFLRIYLDHNSEFYGNASGAAIQAGYAVRQSGFEILSSPVVKEYFLALMDAQGITDAYLNAKLIKLLEAKKVQSCNVFIANEDGKMVANENSNDFIEVDDNSTQLGALKMAHSLKGRMINVYGKDDGAKTVNNTNMVIIVEKEAKEEDGKGNVQPDQKTESSVQIIDCPE